MDISQVVSSNAQPISIELVSGETFHLQPVQIGDIKSSNSHIHTRHLDHLSALNVADIHLANKENADFCSDIITNSSIIRTGDISESVITVPTVQILQLAQGPQFVTNFPERSLLRFDSKQSGKVVAGNEATDKECDEASLSLQSNGHVILRCIDGTKNYLFDPCSLNVFIAENENETYAEDISFGSVYDDDAAGSPSGQLMVKLVKECNDLDDKVPDSRTITVDTDHKADVLCKDDQCPSVGTGPWTCNKCEATFEKWAKYRKHEKLHDEDKPFQCPVCTESFNVEKNLQLHINIHNMEDLVCPECGKEFRRLASFKSHLTVHQEEEIVTCFTCGEEFFSQNQLNAHQIKHMDIIPVANQNGLINIEDIKQESDEETRSYVCKKCGASCSSIFDLKKHMFLHFQVKKLTSSRAKRKFTDRSMFEKKCNVCGKGFLKPSQVLRHMRIHTGERPFKCNFSGCGRAFNQKGTLLIHMNIHTGNKSYVCELCNKSFVQKSNLRGHVMRVHPLAKGDGPLFSCEECPCVFKRANSLNAHISRVHMSETLVETDKNSDEFRSLIRQLQALEGNGSLNKLNRVNKAIANATDTGKGNKNLSLKLTDGDILQQALRNSGLDQAKESQPTDEERDGDILKEKFLQTVKIMTVIERRQDGNTKRYPVLVRLQDDMKWYVCDFEGCTKEFKKPSDLVRHIRIHTNEKPYQCKKCPRAFSIKATLMGHMKTHLVEKEYSCLDCKKKFTTAASLKTHSWVHSGLKPYKCTMCTKTFRTISHRKAHILSHTQSPYRMHTLKKKSMPLPDIPLQEPLIITSQGPVKQISRYKNVYCSDGISTNRPHRCRYCSAAFKKSSHVKQHERTHTGERPFKCENCFKTFSSHSVLKSHIKTHTGSQTHTCEVCLKVFASKGSVKRHFTTHSDSRPYLCPYCHKTFKTHTNCKKHMKTHKQELALDAVRAAGANLQGDSEQAVLTASVYGNHSSSDTSETVLDITSSAVCDQLKTEPIISFQNSDTDKLIDSNLQECSSGEYDSNSAIQIHATFTQDLLDGSITLTDFQSKKPAVTSECSAVQILSQSPHNGLTSSSSLLHNIEKHNSKILLSREGETICHPETSKAGIEQPVFLTSGVIFGTLGNLRQDGCHENSLAVQTLSETPATLIQKHSEDNVLPGPVSALIQSEGQNHGTVTFTAQHVSNDAAQVTESFKTSFPVISPQTVIDATGKSVSLTSPEAVFELTAAAAAAEVTVHPGKKSDKQELLIEGSSILEDVLSHNTLSRGANRDESIQSEFVNSHSPSSESLMLSRSTLTPSCDKSEVETAGPHVQLLPLIEIEDSSNIEQCTTFRSKTSEHSVVETRRKQKRSRGTSPLRHGNSSEILEQQYEDPEPVKPSGYQCNECGKVYQKLHHMKSHMKWHKTPPSCKQCGETFSTPSELREHSQTHKKKTCHECKLQFISPIELLNHNKKVHNKTYVSETESPETADKKSWYCPVCKTLFSSCDAVQQHLVSHSGEEISVAMTEQKKQEILSADLNKSARLKLEMTSEAVDQLLQEAESLNDSSNRIHGNQSKHSKTTSSTKRGDFRHQCSACGKGFKKPSDLTRHIRTHTGEKPYECSICFRKFAVKSTLAVHARTHTGKKEYRCTVCNTYYSSKGSLEIHMRLHTGVKPLKCAYCGMRFRTSGHRKTHVMKHFKLKDGRIQRGEMKEELSASTQTVYEGETTDQENINSLGIDEDEDEINSVIVNPDGTVTLQLNGMSLNALDTSTLLSLQHMNLSDTVFDTVQYCNSVPLEIQTGNVADDAGGEGESSLSVNPNIVMTQRDSVVTANKGKIDFAKKQLDADLNSNSKYQIRDRVKIWRCPYPDCPQSFQSEKHLQFHVDTLHNINYECSECKEVFLSQSSLQHHFFTEHCASKLFRCTHCRREFINKEELDHHSSSSQCHCAVLAHTDNSLAKKINVMRQSSVDRNNKLLLVDNVRESLDEDTDPLMIRDIFLSQQ